MSNRPEGYFNHPGYCCGGGGFVVDTDAKLNVAGRWLENRLTGETRAFVVRLHFGANTDRLNKFQELIAHLKLPYTLSKPLAGDHSLLISRTPRFQFDSAAKTKEKELDFINNSFAPYIYLGRSYLSGFGNYNKLNDANITHFNNLAAKSDLEVVLTNNQIHTVLCRQLYDVGMRVTSVSVNPNTGNRVYFMNHKDWIAHSDWLERRVLEILADVPTDATAGATGDLVAKAKSVEVPL